MAPLTRSRKRALADAAPVIDPADRLSRLPDEVLAQILSFLPAQEAVQTCVLARTWRHVWKLTTRLLLTATVDHDYVKGVRKFVDGLLRIRLDRLHCAPLNACEIMVDPNESCDHEDPIDLDDEDIASVNTWIRFVLECKVQMLRVDIRAEKNLAAYFPLKPFASPHLARLELEGVQFMCTHLDLSGCPALEYLEINESVLCNLEEMTSPSLKRLVITSCETTQDDLYTIEICAPRLVSLWLEACDWTPLLESMPDLVWAHVEFHSDRCRANFDSKSAENAKECFVLEGLAAAEDLVMAAYDVSTEVFKSDLRWCPTFSKLKTLVLNDLLCEPDDSTLACILEHAPVLEKFTFIFSDETWGKYKLEVKGRVDDETLKSTVTSQHLKKVNVKCRKVDGKVLSILNFFGKLNICFQIRVTEKRTNVF
ncbi:unnamed protein product [Urochloa humidicola]